MNTEAKWTSTTSDPETQAHIRSIVDKLAARWGRLPTDDEVYDFIMGDDVIRRQLWNKEIS